MIAAAIIGWEMQRMMMVFRDNFSLGAGIQFLDYATNRPEMGWYAMLISLCRRQSDRTDPGAIQQAKERQVTLFGRDIQKRSPHKVKMADTPAVAIRLARQLIQELPPPLNLQATVTHSGFAPFRA
jgi:hypothetical protein